MATRATSLGPAGCFRSVPPSDRLTNRRSVNFPGGRIFRARPDVWVRHTSIRGTGPRSMGDVTFHNTRWDVDIGPFHGTVREVAQFVG